MMIRRAMLLAACAVALPTRARAQDAGAAPVTAGDVWARYDALLRAVVRGGGVDYGALRGRLGELRAIHAWMGDNGPTRTPGAFATAGDFAPLSFGFVEYVLPDTFLDLDIELRNRAILVCHLHFGWIQVNYRIRADAIGILFAYLEHAVLLKTDTDSLFLKTARHSTAFARSWQVFGCGSPCEKTTN